MEALFSGLTVGLLAHLGKKVIDSLWNSVAKGASKKAGGGDNSGAQPFAKSRHTTVLQDYPVAYHELTTVTGRFYLPDSIAEELLGDEVALLLAIEETGEDSFLFEVNIKSGYQLDLPYGIYSFYVFLLDGYAENFFEATLYAMGLPVNVALPDVDELDLDDNNYVWNLVDDVPLDLSPEYDSYLIDFVFIDSLMLPGQPNSISELFGVSYSHLQPEGALDVTGSWVCEGEYDFGTSMSDVYLVQFDNEIEGVFVMHSVTDDGRKYLIQQFVAGTIDGENITFSGYDIRVLRGSYDEHYILDNWYGVVVSDDIIEGYSVDNEGTEGSFRMERMPEA